MQLYDVEPWWHEDAACRGVGWDAFFPEPGKGVKPDYSAAVALCAGCPTQARCLADRSHVGPTVR